jgi:hypothetical protein
MIRLFNPSAIAFVAIALAIILGYAHAEEQPHAGILKPEGVAPITSVGNKTFGKAENGPQGIVCYGYVHDLGPGAVYHDNNSGQRFLIASIGPSCLFLKGPNKIAKKIVDTCGWGGYCRIVGGGQPNNSASDEELYFIVDIITIDDKDLKEPISQPKEK